MIELTLDFGGSMQEGTRMLRESGAEIRLRHGKRSDSSFH
jgi:hypothetical protein